MTFRDERTWSVYFGQVRTGSDRLGQVRTGSDRFGQVRTGVKYYFSSTVRPALFKFGPPTNLRAVS